MTPEMRAAVESCRHEWRSGHSPICENLMDHQGTCCCGKWEHESRCLAAVRREMAKEGE